jgi:hypothetical protein
MSAEIHGFDRQKDGKLVGKVANLTSAVMVECGESTPVAYTIGSRAAEYAGEITFAALRKIGVLTGEIDLEEFERAVEDVEQGTLPGGRLEAQERRRAEQEMLDRWGP